MLSEILTVITQVAMLTFVVAGMAAMGLGLTLHEIISPLRDLRLVAGLLVANFVVVPAVAVGLSAVLPMEDAAATAVLLLGCTAGAPFLPKLAQLAKADAGLAVGAMVLLMVVTIGYAPLVVPLVVSGASVDPGDIASSLVIFMLLPLALGLLVRARYPELAQGWTGPVGQISSVGLVLGIVAGLLVTWREVVAAVGSLIFVAVLLLVVAALAAGWLAGFGRPSGDRPLLALGTAQRNISAALVVAASIGSDVIVLTLVAALVLPIVLIVLAGEIGKRRPEERTAPS